ncbi:MAG: hypothetical protein ACR2OD_01270 [Gaiellaceae bacterium]
MPGTCTGEGEFPTQLRDVSGGVRPSPADGTKNGLFWTIQVPDHNFWVSKDGRHARLRLRDVCLVETFQFASFFERPAFLSLDVKWWATGDAVPRGEKHIKSDDAFLNEVAQGFDGHIAPAKAKGWFRTWEEGYEAKSHGTSERGWAQMGHVCNGVQCDAAAPAAKKAPPKKGHHKKERAKATTAARGTKK